MSTSKRWTLAQLNYLQQRGGVGAIRPSDLENLYTKAILESAFAGWDIEELVEYEDDISEGAGHKGQSALIGLVARKP